MRSAFTSVFRNLSIRRKSYNAPISVNGIEVRGDVNGNIVIGHGNRILQYVVNKIHGTVINYYTRPAVKLRDVKPQPPRLPTDFVGRETELKALEQQIKSRNAVLLHGHEGIGKTTLIKKAANGDATSALPDGVIFLEREEDQSQILGFEDLLQKLFDALHESDPHLKVDRTVARTYLSNTKPLVLIDRFDIPVQSLITLPDYFPKGAVVVTTLDAIPTEAYESIGLAPLSRDDSIQLLSVKSGIDRNAGSIPIMDEICAILADVPLAITTTAKAIREKRTTLSDVSSQLKRLQSSSSDKTQAAIERGYALVYSLLNREERDALLAAAVSSGISIDREMLESIVG
ncbi:MAG TPA: ATP-binding protein, partial [Anaerolineales bacterium]|nr:ATP-binding protein [Anaerolineales bacterium]